MKSKKAKFEGKKQRKVRKLQPLSPWQYLREIKALDKIADNARPDEFTMGDYDRIKAELLARLKRMRGQS